LGYRDDEQHRSLPEFARPSGSEKMTDFFVAPPEVGLPPADSRLSLKLFVFAKKKEVVQCFCCWKPDLAILMNHSSSQYGEIRPPTTRIYFNSFRLIVNK